MVSGKTNERKTVMVQGKADEHKKPQARSHGIAWGMVVLVFLTAFVVAGLVLIIAMSVLGANTSKGEPVIGECPSLSGIVNSSECMIDLQPAQKIDLQDVVDAWTSSVGGEKGVIIYDLMAGEVAGEYDADVKFATASVYKLFVVYAGYLKIENGEWSSEDAAGGTGYTVGQCLDLAIRESYSECAETLWDMIGRDELDMIVQEELDLPEITVGSLAATPREVMKMMLKFYRHDELSDDLATRMMDSFLNQPKTIYDWRQGLPAGFSERVRVYNKVGWEYDGRKWLIYNDAAIVDFVDDERDFIVVVMTNGVDFKQITRFGRELETKFYDILSFGG